MLLLGIAGCGALPSQHRPFPGRPRLAGLGNTASPEHHTGLLPAHPPVSHALRIRGGGGAAAPWSPDKVMNAYFGGLAVGIAGVRMAASAGSKKSGGEVAAKDAGFSSLQARFLAVFWLFKLADWLHGPYFYEVCILFLLCTRAAKIWCRLRSPPPA